MNADPRIRELEELAAEEGIKLPMHPVLIAWFEDHGYVVDLVTGVASKPTQVGMPTPSGIAVAHLLHDAVGEVAL